MILSMTGYGKAETTFRGKKLICEIRSLNSKSMDLSVRLASQLRAHELDIRTIITQRLERGKVDLSIDVQGDKVPSTKDVTPVNWMAAKEYADGRGVEQRASDAQQGNRCFHRFPFARRSFAAKYVHRKTRWNR